MHFRFCWANHEAGSSRRSLEDIVLIVAHQLMALGHTWDISDDELIVEAPEPVVNILVEGFEDGPCFADIERLHDAGARIGILATEQPTPLGFNWGADPLMVKRQAFFHRAAALADWIMPLVPGDEVLAWYAQFGKPVAYLPLGFAPTLLVKPYAGKKRWHFGTYGGAVDKGNRRHAVVKRFAAAGYPVRVVGGFPERAVRDAEMDQCHAILQIRPNDDAELVSSCRIATMLHRGLPVVAEPHKLAQGYDELITFAPTEADFVRTAILVRATARGTYEAQLQRFQRRFSPQACIGRALEQVGLVGERIAA